MPADAELVGWVDSCLAEAGIHRTGEVVPFRERVWASVFTAPTDHGPVWLKTMPLAVTHEAGLYAVLERHVPNRIVTPLGVDALRGRLLLPDAGPPLRDRYDGDDLTDALAAALHAYGRVQLALAPHVDELLATGTADMRPERMPERFDEALEYAERFARRERQDIGVVVALRSRYRDWCAELVASGRPASLDHNDLHTNNVIGSRTHPRFYDWGDAVVAHPFATLLTPLQTAPVATRDRLRNSYLAAFGDPMTLRSEAELAVRVSLVARALVWLRVLGDHPERHEHAAAPVEHLRQLLD